MKPFRILFLLLIISLHLCSCSSTKALKLYKPVDGSSIQKFSPLGGLSEPLLFKAGINLFKDHHSGLFLIKRMPGDSSIRVVFLSELGLNLMDLNYRNDEFEVVSVKEFLDKRPILETLQNDFRTLLLDLSLLESYSVMNEQGENREVLKFKYHSQKYAYYHGGDEGTYRIERKKGLFNKVDFIIQGKDEMNIGIAHKGIRLQIELHQLRQFNEHDH